MAARGDEEKEEEEEEGSPAYRLPGEGGRLPAGRWDAAPEAVAVQALILQKLILQSSTLRTPLCPRIPQPGRLAVQRRKEKKKSYFKI